VTGIPPMALDLETVVSNLKTAVLSPRAARKVVPPKAKPQERRRNFRKKLVKSKLADQVPGPARNAGKNKIVDPGRLHHPRKIGRRSWVRFLQGQHRRMDRTVAIHRLLPRHDKRCRRLLPLERDQSGGKTLHPNIVPALDADQAKGVHFLVMETSKVKTVSHRQAGRTSTDRQGRPLTFLQAAKGLEFPTRRVSSPRHQSQPTCFWTTRDVRILDMVWRGFESDGPPRPS